MDRDCNKCVYSTRDGGCRKWTCEGTKTIDDIRSEVIEECKKAIVNTESKVFNPCADKSWDMLTLLADRQIEILNILDQLKGQGR